ncbi:MAG: hypothetical protein QOG62_2709 [Thermoleophilaceae bacterium]|nr:hypothetical protein [Thermoleophilaceae bacterium]
MPRMGDLVRKAGERGEIAAELSRRDVLARASRLGVGALILSAMPIVEQLGAPAAVLAAPDEHDGLLQAFCDTIIPGRVVDVTDLGHEIHPKAIAGVDPEPGAVEADSLLLMNDVLLGFPALAPAFLADLIPRALLAGGDFLSLPFEKRVEVVAAGMSFENPLRLVWEGAAGIPFVAFCAAGTQRNATSKTASGYKVMGYPGAAPGGYKDFSYRRPLAKGRTKKGYLP